MSSRNLPLLVAALSVAATLTGLVVTEGVAFAATGTVTTKQCKDAGGKVSGTTCTGGTYDKRTVADPAPSGLHGSPGWWPTIPVPPHR